MRREDQYEFSAQVTFYGIVVGIVLLVIAAIV